MFTEVIQPVVMQTEEIYAKVVHMVLMQTEVMHTEAVTLWSLQSGHIETPDNMNQITLHLVIYLAGYLTICKYR